MVHDPVPNIEVYGSSAINFEDRQVSDLSVSLEGRLSMVHDLVPTLKHTVSAPKALR
jgi:hypothetical protein